MERRSSSACPPPGWASFPCSRRPRVLASFDACADEPADTGWTGPRQQFDTDAAMEWLCEGFEVVDVSDQQGEDGPDRPSTGELIAGGPRR
jgi:hypothetical protein